MANCKPELAGMVISYSY